MMSPLLYIMSSLSPFFSFVTDETFAVKTSYELNFGYMNAHYHQSEFHAVAMSLYHIICSNGHFGELHTLQLQ